MPGGFKQRLALGCAILHEPSILFLDEPTSGVDPISRRNFWNLIHEMAKGGTTVFVTTHYMDEADYCDRLALIYRGKIIAAGTPNQLRKEFMSRDVLEIEAEPLVSAMEALDRTGDRDRDIRQRAPCYGGEREKRHTTDLEDPGRIFCLGKQNRKIVPSLEDVFVTLIEKA